MSDDLTPSEEILIKEFESGKSLSEASAIAFPESRRAMELATELLKENDYVRARFHMYMNDAGVSDLDIAKTLGRAFEIAEEDPKASTALLNATKFAVQLKNLLPQQSSSINVQAPITFLTQQQTVNNYGQQVKDRLDDEDIDNLLKEDIIDIEIIDKNNLFDDKE